jgi:uncharacterized protein (TIGR01777 family)
VLGQNGGALAKMLLPFKFGLGGPVGNGHQIMSWIHIDDWINAALYLLTSESSNGPYNLTAPYPVSNSEFTKALAKAVKRPAFFRVPCFSMKLLLGKGAELLCEGQKVIPKKLSDEGFEFTHVDIYEAMQSCV